MELAFHPGLLALQAGEGLFSPSELFKDRACFRDRRFEEAKNAAEPAVAPGAGEVDVRGSRRGDGAVAVSLVARPSSWDLERSRRAAAQARWSRKS
ncbi:MAG: hypothetical protein M3203_10890 [Actinomycetota bacterium]|nr:hypothetical protein [Actinomycetota bacterium]